MIFQKLLTAVRNTLGLDLPKLRTASRARGTVDLVFRYSPLYPNTKLRGSVCRYVELGSNLVVARGRYMSAGLWAGGSNAGIFTDNRGLSEATAPNPGWVVRGMAVGEDDTAEADDDTELGTPITNPSSGTHYHAIDLITYTAYPNTEVVFGRTFAPTEPTATDALIQEFGLYTAAPAGFAVSTDPAGPSGGPYLVARKTHGLITKTADFTMQVLWTIEF